ncbi:MAG: MFS transporter, partial [Oscillospiraceae bacterium]|nr:MFS transporter [Oscillospiraceae bacterium]
MSNKKRNLVLVVIEGLFANLLFGSLFVWTMLRNPLLELFPTWNEGMLSVIFGIHNLFICVGIMLGGLLCRKLPTRKVFCIFLTLAVIGLAGFALLPVAKPTLAYWMAFTLFCIFAAFGVGIGINVTQSTTIPWFPKNSGAISGALYMALGVSSVIMAAIAQRIMPVIGVKYILPVFAGLILIVGVLILCDRKSITAPVKEAATGKELEGIPP